MESSANPYSNPSASLYGTAPDGAADAVPPGAVAALAGTKPWVRFMSVLIWLLSGLLLFMSFAVVFTVVIGAYDHDRDAAFLKKIVIGTAAYYALAGFAVIYPALKLWKYASGIAQVMNSRTTADLDAALNHQRRYWKFQGIMVIIVICLGIIGTIAVAALAGAAAMKGGGLPH